MEVGRRISASPRPCSGRRVLAKKKRAAGDGFVNSVKKLQRREISSKRDRAFGMSNAQERFRNMHLMEEYDTHDPKGHSTPKLPFLLKRTKVIEIVAARDIVFALAHSGVCAAFSRGPNLNEPIDFEHGWFPGMYPFYWSYIKISVYSYVCLCASSKVTIIPVKSVSLLAGIHLMINPTVGGRDTKLKWQNIEHHLN